MSPDQSSSLYIALRAFATAAKFMSGLNEGEAKL